MRTRNPADAPTLEEVLLALQKSFSRLSARTAEGVRDQPERARALIVGDVAFEIALHVEPVDEAGAGPGPDVARFDKLRYRPEGGAIALKLNGTLSPDVRVGETGDALPGATDPPSDPGPDPPPGSGEPNHA